MGSHSKSVHPYSVKAAGRRGQEGPNVSMIPPHHPIQHHTAQNRSLTNAYIHIHMNNKRLSELHLRQALRQVLSLQHLSLLLLLAI